VRCDPMNPSAPVIRTFFMKRIGKFSMFNHFKDIGTKYKMSYCQN
jgi:hypothetical protein